MKFSRYVSLLRSPLDSRLTVSVVSFVPTLSLLRVSMKNRNIFLYFLNSTGSHLLSHAVTSIVPSAAFVLTIVFGMYNGCFPKAHRHRKWFIKLWHLITQQWNNFLYSISLERRWSSRTFRYGYLVTTSPQLSDLPSAAPSLRLGHWLRVFPTPMVWRAVCTRPGNVFTATFWFAITSDSSFVQSSCRLQSELRRYFWDLLHLAALPPFVYAIVARV